MLESIDCPNVFDLLISLDLFGDPRRGGRGRASSPTHACAASGIIIRAAPSPATSATRSENVRGKKESQPALRDRDLYVHKNVSAKHRTPRAKHSSRGSRVSGGERRRQVRCRHRSLFRMVRSLRWVLCRSLGPVRHARFSSEKAISEQLVPYNAEVVNDLSSEGGST